ncbi:uncharacterized protein LOC122039077 [Zingiber officinale]|uniref:uncharacterized protein LOC122039077 n=1 Tax=Zingiber officinale TaxID=94328 RepID=UPI001C4ABF95|nr:uncharacterized protein LOC122039077 [Zingiber officinale]
MEESGRIHVTMTAGEYELFKEAKRLAASERQATVSRPRQAPAEASKEPLPVSDRGSKRKQPECYPHQQEQPQASVAESSQPRDSKKGKALVIPEAFPEDPDEKVPFSAMILNERLPKGYRAPSIEEYDGSKDPEDHLAFLNTLSGSSLKWFDGLPQGSITCFLDFKTAFLRRFASSKKYQKTDHCLFALKQRPTEPLRSYINRFNQVTQDVPTATSEILMSAFSHGLGEGEFFRDLIKNPARNFDEMVEKAASYIKVEEAQAARRKAEKPLPPTNRQERRAPQPPPQPLPRAREVRPAFHSGPEIRPAPRVAAVHIPRPRPGSNRYCTYHRSHTHDTNHCFQFARDSKRVAEMGLPPPELAPQLIKMMEEQRVAGQAGPSRPDLAGTHQPGRGKEPEGSREVENRGNAAVREIGMISGGPTDGDSGRARKSHVRRLEVHAVGCSQDQAAGPVISFGPADLEGLELPHDDALIIKAIIANNRVARVFVDTGSSVDILFRTAFEEMQIDAAELQPVATSLYGFTGNEVKHMSQIKLAISLGTEPLGGPPCMNLGPLSPPFTKKSSFLWASRPGKLEGNRRSLGDVISIWSELRLGNIKGCRMEVFMSFKRSIFLYLRSLSPGKKCNYMLSDLRV